MAAVPTESDGTAVAALRAGAAEPAALLAALAALHAGGRNVDWALARAVRDEASVVVADVRWERFVPTFAALRPAPPACWVTPTVWGWNRTARSGRSASTR
ncbi:hypothetical protein [Micromonospora sp. RTGN7]|uniref:hypothetical protein n=1 Tax=Micromonospora sp. RTGN7 TaxID=3016526 RepID=UPI0029FF50E3|nr:hypothetical protein [Micromonospora sp. RTGN7]